MTDRMNKSEACGNIKNNEFCYTSYGFDLLYVEM